VIDMAADHDMELVAPWGTCTHRPDHQFRTPVALCER
jgi:hypothetical protein